MRWVSRPTLPGRQAGAALRTQMLGGRGSTAAMAAPASSENVDEGTRLQRAAAWQWFMRGAGADAHAHVLHVEASAARREMKTLAFRQTSRFAQEAAYLSRTSKLPLFDDVQLPGLGAFVAQPQNLKKHLYARRSKQQAPCLSEKRAQRRLEKKTHLPFIGFQRLLQKLVLPKSSNEGLFRLSSAVVSKSEDEVHHHYHRYIHYHHHHHFYPDKPGAPVEELVVSEQSHGGVAGSHRRRYSESALCYEPLQKSLYDNTARQPQSVTGSCRWQDSQRTYATGQPADYIWD